MTRKAHSAFSLVELLIVMGIIIVLVSILLPALGSARAISYRLRCQNNLKQILTATQQYVINDPEGRLPFANWKGGLDTPAHPGWLYTSPNNGSTSPQDMRTGALWKYIQNEEVYHCPLHNPPYSSIDGPAVNITSYLINGAVCHWGGQSPSYALTAFKKPSECIIYFECASTGDPVLPNYTAPTSSTAFFNDGSSFPSENAVSTRHGRVATVGFFDFHVEAYYVSDFRSQQTLMPGALFCVPNSPNGN